LSDIYLLCIIRLCFKKNLAGIYTKSAILISSYLNYSPAGGRTPPSRRRQCVT